MRLINNLKFLDESDIASLPNTDSKVKRSDKASKSPKVNSLLSGKRVPVNCQNVGQDSPNEIFYKGREILQEYQKMVQGHPNLTDFSTHPSDHTNLTGRNQPGEPENLDHSFSLGLHVILGQLNSSYDSPITAFACADRASCLKREDSQGSDHGFMASGHADGAIILYKVSQVHIENLTGLHSDESNRMSLAGEADKIVELSSPESNAPVSVECISLALGNSGRIKVLKFVKSETGLVVFSVTDSGEVSKWDTRDGNCLASFQPPEQLDTHLIDDIFPVGIDDEYLLCTGPGTLLRLTASDLKLASNLSEEMFYTSALPIQANRSINQVPILVMGPNCGDITLGNFSTANRESLNLLCKLSLRIEVVYWESNVYASSPDMQQVLLVSPSAFILVQIEQTQTMRQLTQSIPPPIADDTWAGGFFMPENQLLVFTTGGSTYHYSWDAAGGLMRIGEATPTEAPPLAATRFTSIFWLNKDYLINVLPGSSLIIGTRINLPSASSANTLIQEWQQQLPKPGEVNSGVVTALTPIYLETESDPDPRPWLAKGFKDGTICVVPLAQMFDRSEKDAAHLLSSQGYAITCLHQPSGVGKKQLLISGDACGGIRLWELSSWVRLASFQGHGQPVGTFFQFPVMPADQSLVFGLAQDASISIFCLKRMVCLGLIPGHRAAVSQVLCYPEAILEVVYSDGYHTYWILHPNGVRKWTEKVTVPRIFGVQLTRMRSPSLRADITCYPAWDMQHPFPVLQVFDINVRSLLRSMNSSIEPVVRLLNQAKNLPTLGEASRRTSLLPEDSQPSSDSSLKLSKLIFYALLTKDADVSDILCDTFDPSANQLLIGLRGAGSKITFMLHESNVSQTGKAEVWKVSPHATASRLLPSIVMAKAAHTHEGNESKAIAVLTNYGCLLPELVGEAFQFPCLGYMAKFWQDSSPDVQSASRSLLLSLFSQLGFTRQRQLVDQWVTLLPQTVPIDLIHLQGSGLAVVVLGIILAHYPNLISDVAIRGRIARSLEWFVSSHTRPNFRLSAIQIVSSNFQHFETHVDGVWILRSLYGAYHEQSRHMQLISQQAVLQLALANTPLFISSLGLAKGIHQLGAIMQLISFLVLNNQSLLLPYIPRVIEVIVKSLDPRDSEQRQSLISPATQCLHDLVAAYSTVDFHPGSQRLAVGVMEGAAVVYDLYTSTRCLVVEGYHSPVSAVAFSPDGKFLATFSAQESLLKIWNSAGGLFDMLAKTFRGHTPAAVPASKSRSNRAVNSMFLTLPSASDAAPVSAPTSGRTSPRNLAPPREYSGSISGTISPLGLFSSSPTPYRTFNTSLGNCDSVPI